MKWLEIIAIRTASMADQPIHFLKHAAGSLLAPGLKEASVCSHASIPGDFAITLFWETEKTKPWGSDLAIGLVQELKNLGLVDHSIWIIQQRQAKNGE